MSTEQKFELLTEMISNKKFVALKKELIEMNEVDIAHFIETLSPQSGLVVFRMLGKEEALHTFSELRIETQQHILASISDKEISVIIDDLWVDDAVDMLEEMPATLVKKVLRNSSKDARKLINQFLKYPEHSAGSIMTAEFIDLNKKQTVAEALKSLRKVQHGIETIYTCYVIDGTRILEGVVTMKDLLLAKDEQTVGEIMISDIICVHTGTDKEETAKTLAKYGFIALPVVDSENRLVGIVTVDDAMEVLQEEDTEDFLKMAAITPSETPYMKTSAFKLAKDRLPWLLILLMSNMLTSVVLGVYEPVYVALPVLFTFMPMLTGTGGNAGGQSSTMIIRGMALGEITTKDAFKVLRKEVLVCLLVGAVLAVINFARLIWTYPGQYALAGLVSFALLAAIFIGKSMGSMLPMIAKACKVDPALVAAPLITTIVDVLALMLYYGIASQIMPIMQAQL